VKPPFSYFGGKTRLAPWIASLLPAHRVYVEPFAGSAAVLFAKSPATQHEIINDVYGEVVNFFRDEYNAADLEVELDELERARRWWVRSTQAFGSVSARSGWSTSIEQNSNNARTVLNRIGRFAASAERLAKVTIENRDALEVIDRYDAVDGIIYCDPPYLGSVRTSFRDGRRPNGDYPSEFETDDQHRELAGILHHVKALVIVSGYASELYDDELFPDWHRIEHRVLARASNARGGRDRHRTEVLWSNRPLEDALFVDERIGATS
jgi:DNA adenine methylase